MKKQLAPTTPLSATFNARLAAYVSAAGGASLAGTAAKSAVVGSAATIPIGVNSEVSIDFNLDGQIDFQIDHDRYNLNGSTLDYLQIDKNDVNSELDPLPVDGFLPFPAGMTIPNDAADAGYIIDGAQGNYPAALAFGSPIGETLPDGQRYDFQEGDNAFGGGQMIRNNRLIDEDAGQVDQAVGGKTPDQIFDNGEDPHFLGLGGEVRYLGLRMALNDEEGSGPGPFNYGWIGIRIDNEADATGAVVGYAYESTEGVAITTGDVGTPTLDADFDNDGDADGDDFLLWQRGLGSTVAPGTGADATGDGQVDGADLNVWRGEFGTAVGVATPNTSVVPEPDALWMGLGGCLVLACVFARCGRKASRVG